MIAMPHLPDEVRAGLPPEAQAYISALEALVSALSAEVRGLHAQVPTLQAQVA